jgi:hypothetical protein
MVAGTEHEHSQMHLPLARAHPATLSKPRCVEIASSLRSSQ